MTEKHIPQVPSDDVEQTYDIANLKPGTLLDEKFRIVKKLGSGTVGQVYEAVHSLIGHRVAIKLLSNEMAVRRDAIMLLLHEARIANSIRHPNIVQMTDMAQSREGTLYLVMELLEGQDLGRFMSDRGPISRLESFDIVDQICKALSAAHEQGVYHRDLKPQNIFLVRPEEPVPRVKLLDFGLSKVCQPGTRSLWYSGGNHAIGTPLYIAPELAKLEKDADHRADIYSFGVILYQMWTGRLPFNAPSIDEVLKLHIEQEPPMPSSFRPGMTEQTEHILLRALAKDPCERYQTIDELRIEIETVNALPRVPNLEDGSSNAC